MKYRYEFPIILTTVLFSLMIALPACGLAITPQETQANRPPVIEQLTGSANWSPETSGEFSVVASDPDGDKLAYTWLADNGTLTAEGNSATWVSPSSMGKYAITVVVNDGRGGETRGVKDVKVIVNADGTQTPDAPVLLKMSFPSSENITASKRVRIWSSSPVECVVTGADPVNLKYAWTVTNGRIQAKGLNEGKASKVVWIAPGVGGACDLDVTVTDSQGNQSKGTVKFNVFCCGNY